MELYFRNHFRTMKILLIREMKLLNLLVLIRRELIILHEIAVIQTKTRVLLDVRNQNCR